MLLVVPRQARACASVLTGPSTRVELTLRPRFRLTAWTPAPRTRVPLLSDDPTPAWRCDDRMQNVTSTSAETHPAESATKQVRRTGSLQSASEAPARSVSSGAAGGAPAADALEVLVRPRAGTRATYADAVVAPPGCRRCSTACGTSPWSSTRCARGPRRFVASGHRKHRPYVVLRPDCRRGDPPAGTPFGPLTTGAGRTSTIGVELGHPATA